MDIIKTIGSYTGFAVFTLFIIYLWYLVGFPPIARWAGGDCYLEMMDRDGDGIEECTLSHCWDGRGLVFFWAHWGECERK